MIVYGQKDRQDVFNVCCSNCGVIVGDLHPAEVVYLERYLKRAGEEILCFDCDDATEVNATPMALIPPLFGALILDNEILVIDADSNHNPACVKVVEILNG